jgi:hypothetical protein
MRLLISLVVVAITVLAFVPPIPQDPAYHNFADRRTILGVPNFLNVISNAPFAVIGILALWRVRCGSARILFAGVTATAFGSAWYHLWPGNDTLVWDRLPMTLVFMTLFSVVIADRIDEQLGRLLLWPMITFGAASIIFWRITEAAGHGDLRLYGIVQFLPMVAIPAMMLLYPARHTGTGDLLAVVGWYAVAKVMELLDTQILSLSGAVSGHTLKHIAAGITTAWLLRYLADRRERPTPDTVAESLREQD